MCNLLIYNEITNIQNNIKYNNNNITYCKMLDNTKIQINDSDKVIIRKVWYSNYIV